MAGTTWREDSSRLAFPSGTDYTVGGTNYIPPFLLVTLNASGQVVTATGNTSSIVGVLFNAPIVGDTADVLAVNNMGTGKVTAGGVIAIGNYLTSNASGQAVAATQAAAGAQAVTHVIGIATMAGAAGQIIEYISVNFLY